MSSETPIFKVPYPDPTDPVADYPITGQALALKVEQLAQPTASVTSAIVAAAGWRVDSSNSRNIGKMVFFQATVTRTGAALTVPASGDVGNTLVATLTPAAVGVSGFIIGPSIGSSTVGRVASWNINGAGAITLVAVAGTSNIATNEQLSLAGLVVAA